MDLITFLLLSVLNSQNNIKSDINPSSYVKNVNNSMVLTDVTSTGVRNVIASVKNSSSGQDEFGRHMFMLHRRRSFITKSANNYITVHYLQKAETQT